MCSEIIQNLFQTSGYGMCVSNTKMDIKKRWNFRKVFFGLAKVNLICDAHVEDASFRKDHIWT